MASPANTQLPASMSSGLLDELRAAAGGGNVLLAEPMSAHTTFQVGGPADVLVEPESPEAVAAVLAACRAAGVPLLVVGQGSDLLVGDKGIRGVVVLLGDKFARIEVDGSFVRAQAGARLRDVALAAAEAGLGGMEPLCGIPASVGGACYMNAGAYGGETAQVLSELLAVTPGGELAAYKVEDLAMGYRSSRVAADGLVVLEATFGLEPADRAEIEAAMADFQARREEKQPLELPSAGSTFKRPEGYFAGKLIMDSGLAGARVGGAQVSTKHCGFVVNAGGATAADVRALIAHVQDTVEEKFGVRLEPEVRMVGEF